MWSFVPFLKKCEACRTPVTFRGLNLTGERSEIYACVCGQTGHEAPYIPGEYLLP
jgi:hypothetical protein